MPTGNIVKLNIGGKILQTSKWALTRFDGLFKTMLETDVITQDESGAIFIDRDPTHFHRILNYMRDGKIELPKNSEDVKRLQKEAQFYLLDGLVELCESSKLSTKISTEDIAKFNIRGTIFQTRKSTLTRYKFFKTMLETNAPIIKDEFGAIFIDRNPAHFGKILDYMYEGEIALPNSVEDVKDLQNEAQFYHLDGLVELCQMDLNRHIVVFNVGGTIFHTSMKTLSSPINKYSKLDQIVKAAKNRSGAIFIDRSPKHFDSILNYLRDGRWEFPESPRERKELDNEIQYYRLSL